MSDKQVCPCCGNATLNSRCQYEICYICHWEDEPPFPVDDHEGYEFGPNHMTLEKYRSEWIAKGKPTIGFPWGEDEEKEKEWEAKAREQARRDEDEA